MTTPLVDEPAERRRAARALLASPLLSVADPDFRLVRRHAGALAVWFTQETGWRLVVDTESARLFKTPARLDDATHPARTPRTRAPFTRRRYVLLCLALSVLERADAQITLGRLAEGVLTAAADPALTGAGVEFRLERREERSDLVAVVRTLLDWGALERVAGDEEAYLASGGNDVLYDVRRRVLGTLLAAGRGPSTVRATGFEERLAELAREALPETDELRLRALRQRLTRRLLDDPVVYYADLTEEEQAYLVSQRHAIVRRISELTGLVGELRAEGIAMADPEDQLTDVRMPEQGTEGHATLLLAAHLAAVGKPQSTKRLHALVWELATQHQSYWRKAVRDPAGAAEVLAGALDRLEALDLIDRHGLDLAAQTVTAKPALARYSLAAPKIRKARSS